MLGNDLQELIAKENCKCKQFMSDHPSLSNPPGHKILKDNEHWSSLSPCPQCKALSQCACPALAHRLQLVRNCSRCFAAFNYYNDIGSKLGASAIPARSPLLQEGGARAGLEGST